MYHSFNDRLSVLLNEKGIKQKDLAIRVGVTEAAISHYLKGDRIPRASVMAKIADELETTSEYLMNGTSSSSQDEVKYAVKLIARNAAQMSREDKMKIIDILLRKD